MKTTKITFAILFIFSISLNAQLKVSTLGRVDTSNQTVVTSNSNNLNDGFDVRGLNPSLTANCDLIWGYYYASQPNNPGLFTLGSMDGACFTVRANGKVGIFNPNPSVALEIGTVGSNEQVKVNGTIVLGSDERIKDNIKDITNSGDKLKQIRSVSYTFKDTSETQNNNSNISLKAGEIVKPKFIKKSNPDKRNHYGFLAQEVQKVFPDLVYKDSAGMLGVDYIGMIPLLLDAIQNQQVQIDALTELVEKSNSATKKVSESQERSTLELDVISYPVLGQNIPNPFNTATTIGFSLPTSIGSASVYVYDMNGVQLKSYSITERGKGSITIQGSVFIAGMYLYALIADGKVIDTKRMILTK